MSFGINRPDAYQKWTHISTDVVELSDEGVFDNIHSNLWG